MTRTLGPTVTVFVTYEKRNYPPLVHEENRRSLEELMRGCVSDQLGWAKDSIDFRWVVIDHASDYDLIIQVALPTRYLKLPESQDDRDRMCDLLEVAVFNARELLSGLTVSVEIYRVENSTGRVEIPIATRVSA